MIIKNNKQITSVFKGTNKINKIYKGLSLVYTASRLPSSYQEVEYIQTTGTQYITTDFIPYNYDGNYTVIMDIQGNKLPSSNSYLCGCGGTNRSCNVRIQPAGDMTIFNNNTALTNASIVVTLTTAEADILNRNTYEIILRDEQKTKLIKNGIEYTKNTVSKTNGKSKFMIGKSSGTNYPIKIFSWEFYDENNELVGQFIPCYRKLDDEIGMYEMINKVFYTNSGSGTFIKGNNV